MGNRRFSGHGPDECRRIVARGPHGQIGAGVTDGGFNFGARAHDAWIIQQTGNIVGAEPGHDFGVETWKASRNAWRLRRMVAPDRTAWKPSSTSFSHRARVSSLGTPPYCP